MFVLKRRENQWVRITHRLGEVLQIRVKGITIVDGLAQVDLCFEDPPRHFEIEWPERLRERPLRLLVAQTRSSPDPLPARSHPFPGLPPGFVGTGEQARRFLGVGDPPLRGRVTPSVVMAVDEILPTEEPEDVEPFHPIEDFRPLLPDAGDLQVVGWPLFR